MCLSALGDRPVTNQSMTCQEATFSVLANSSNRANQIAVPRPDRFALRILPFRARRNFFPSSPGACSPAILEMVPDYGLRPRLWLLMKSITEVYISLLWHSIFTMTINFLPKMKNSRFASVKSSKVCECNTALAHTIRAIIDLCWCLLPRQ